MISDPANLKPERVKEYQVHIVESPMSDTDRPSVICGHVIRVGLLLLKTVPIPPEPCLLQVQELGKSLLLLMKIQ